MIFKSFNVKVMVLVHVLKFEKLLGKPLAGNPAVLKTSDLLWSAHDGNRGDNSCALF